MVAVSITFFGTSLLFCTLLLHIDGWRPFKLTAKNVTWKILSNSVAMNASISQSGAFNIWVQLLENFNQPFVHAELYVDSGKGEFDFELLNRTIDICEFLRNQRYEPLLQIFYAIVRENGSWPKTCPLQKSQFSIENLIVDPETLPPYLPERKGFITLRFKCKKNGIFKDTATVTAFFELENTAIDRLKNRSRKKNRMF